jgi:1,2-diacylglycerol 3-beta-galactosyltransferase
LPKRILFLMSDTGGGHRAAAEAILDAMVIQYGRDSVFGELVDVFKHSLFPLNYMPEFYPWWVNNSKTTWGAGYNFSNTKLRATALSAGMYLTSGHLLRRMVREHPADVVVCVHSVVARPSMAAYMTLRERPPFVTVVTDLVSTHMFWYEPQAERCLVPTEKAYERGLLSGLQPEQLRITGLPVNPKFCSGLADKATARAKMGWHPSLPAVLLVAGGEGMGPLYETARAIDAMRLNCQLVVIAGKNSVLREQLEQVQWNQPTTIYGFVNDMPLKMAGADMIVTKAGPATICEASIAGLPMILNDAIPGQETGNVEYVVNNKAGVFAPEPQQVASVVKSWLDEGPEGLQHRSEVVRRIAHPDAVWQIAEEVWQLAHTPKITVKRRDYLSQFLTTPREIFPTLS